ncbi:MAG: phosphopantetheine-binding protein [Spirochaetales bacterium]|jgi:acyl carrier protein|nr:phosphopantetheine-binding protein [Spirochaetales bacterium]
MNRNEVFEKLKEILVEEFDLDPAVITPEAGLAADLDLDSIDAVDMIVKMKQYTVGRIEPELFKNARTVQDVVDILVPLAQQVS